MGWQGLGGVATYREGSEHFNYVESKIGALKMQVGWQGLGGIASPKEGSEHKHLNYVWNLYRSPENVGWLAGSR